jgi:hypothetical protein
MNMIAPHKLNSELLGIAEVTGLTCPDHRDSQELDAPELEDTDITIVGLAHAPDPPPG